MDIKHIFIIFKKEVRDAFRDTKSVMTNILLPLVMVTVICFMINIVVNSIMKDISNNFNIAITTEENNINEVTEFTKNKIIKNNKVNIKEYNNEDELKQALKDGEIIFIINYKEGFMNNIKEGVKSKVELLYDSTKNSSQIGLLLLKLKTNDINKEVAKDKLEEANLSENILELTEFSSIDISAGNTGNQFLMMLLPAYLVTIIVTAGTPVAIDIVAGERERKTFEPLLSTSADRLSILIGKFMAVLVFAIIAVITSFIGLMIGILLNPSLIALIGQILGISTTITAVQIPIPALLLTILSVITLTMIFAGIQIAISTGSKTLKEAQTYLSYLMFPASVPALMTIFMGAGDMNIYLSFIPIFNTIASFKMVIAGINDYGFLILGVLTNIIFIALIIWLIIKLFNNEKVIIK